MLPYDSNEFIDNVKSEEVLLAYISIPCATLSLILSLIIIAAIIRASFYPDILDTIWKPKTIFEGLSLFNTVIGTVFSAYGFIFLYNRVYSPITGPIAHQIIGYGFVFHRFLLVGGDLFPSLDRCAAIMYPMKYFFSATPRMALGKQNYLIIQVYVIH